MRSISAPPTMCINLKHELTPYHAPSGPEADGSAWYMLVVTQQQRAPRHPGACWRASRRAWRLSPAAARRAARHPGGGQFGFRRRGRARQGLWRARLAGDHSAGHARWAWRCGWAMPARRPRCQAWTEPALASHNRQLAIFITAVGSLIAAAAHDHGRPRGPDRPCRAALGGADLIHAAVGAGWRAPACSTPASPPISADLMASRRC